MTMDGSFARQVEQLDRRRDRSLAWFLGCFLAWTLATIASMFLLVTPGLVSLALIVPVFALPLAFWLFFLGRYLWIQARIRSDPRLAEALNDELVRTTWLRAAAAGFWAMLAVEVLSTLWRMLTNVTVSMGLVPLNPVLFLDLRAPLTLAVGIGVTIGVYLYQRREA
jgi:hypothetical protein